MSVREAILLRLFVWLAKRPEQMRINPDFPLWEQADGSSIVCWKRQEYILVNVGGPIHTKPGPRITSLTVYLSSE